MSTPSPSASLISEARICVCLGNMDASELSRWLSRYRFCELRLDLLDLSPANIRNLFSPQHRLIVTDRANGEHAAPRVSLLCDCIEAGAFMVDMDICDDTQAIAQVRRAVEMHNAALILSQHFEQPPSRTRIIELKDKALSLGADWIKLAAPLNTRSQTDAFLSLIETDARILPVALGPDAAALRAKTLLRGAAFTYAAPSVSRAVVVGQPDVASILRAGEAHLDE